jgi:hypothetical protein
MKQAISVVAIVVLSAPCLFARQVTSQAVASNEDVSALRQRVADLEQRIALLEQRLQLLQDATRAAQPAAATPAPAPPAPAQAQPPVAPAASPPAPAPEEAGTTGQQPIYGKRVSSASKALNPDISIIGDFIVKAGGNSIQPTRSLQMPESEAGFQAIVDPYARGDFFISFGETGVDLEEGYITFTALPGFTARAGKMRAAFGKVNQMHNHALPWADRPLVIGSLLGGEDGINDAGVSLSRIIPAPKGLFLEATGQIYRGDSGEDAAPVFRSSRHSDVSAVAHLRSYADISESTNFDLGLSYARGHNELGSQFITHLYGLDGTLRWKPLRRSIYHSFLFRTELVWSQRRELAALARAFGFYASADYQLARRWFLGGRYDWSERSHETNIADRRGSLILTYSPSEFSQIRGQYRITEYNNRTSANELLVQLLFSLGAHGAHPF